MAIISEGFKQKQFAKKESSFGAAVAPSTTDAVGGPTMKIEPAAKDDLLKEAVGNGSAQALIRGMESGKWSHVSYIKPTTAGTPPDIDPLLECAFGSRTVSGSSVYTGADTAKSTLALVNHDDSEYQAAFGAWVEQMDVEVKGAGDPPMITFAGGFALYGQACGSVVTTGNSLGASTVTLTAAAALAFRPGGVIKFSGHSTGYLITDVNYTTGVLTLSPVLTATVANGETISPYSPTLTMAGTVLGGVNCGLTIGGTAYPFISAKISMKTGTHGQDKEASSARPTGVISGRREITFEAQFYKTDTTVGPIHGKSWQQGKSAVLLRIGADTTGARCKWSLPNLQWTVTPTEIPETEEVICTLQGVALQSAAAGDELTNTWD